MVENNNTPSNSDKQWDEFSELLPEREDVVIPDDAPSGSGNNSGGGSYGTLSQRMANSPKLSDAQTFDLRLFPKLKTDWLDVLQVSRVFPDTYDDLFMIFVKDLLSEFKDMSVGEAIAQVHTALSIAIDGEGRIDELALSGATSQVEAEKDKAKLGII